MTKILRCLVKLQQRLLERRLQERILNLLTELLKDDLIQLPTGAAGATETFRVNSITNNLALVVAQTGAWSSSNTTVAVTSSKATRIRAKLKEEEETVLVYKTPKDNTKTLLNAGVSDTSYTFRKQFTRHN